MNNTQIAHLIVKALNSGARYRRYSLDQKNKKQLMARMHTLQKQPISDVYKALDAVESSYVGGPVPLNRAVQILTPLLKDPVKCFTEYKEEHPWASLVNKTLKYYLEHGAP